MNYFWNIVNMVSFVGVLIIIFVLVKRMTNDKSKKISVHDQLAEIKERIKNIEKIMEDRMK